MAPAVSSPKPQPWYRYARVRRTWPEHLFWFCFSAIFWGPAFYLIVLMPLGIGYREAPGQALARADADIKMLSTQLKTFEMAMWRPPTAEEGLQALIDPPASVPHPERGRRLLAELPLDPWGNPYIYVCPAQRSGHGFDLYSLGPDRKAGTEDDVANWK